MVYHTNPVPDPTVYSSVDPTAQQSQMLQEHQRADLRNRVPGDKSTISALQPKRQESKPLEETAKEAPEKDLKP